MLDKFPQLTLDGILGLSPRQIQDFFLHARKEDGSIDAPAQPIAPANQGARISLLLELMKTGLVKGSDDDRAKLEGMLSGLGGGAKPATE